MKRMSSKHFMFFIIATSIIALRSYTSIFIEYGGRDTWFISLIASLLIFIYFIFPIKVCLNHNEFDFHKIINSCGSKTVSGFLILLFSIGLFLSSIESLSVEASSIHTNFFLSTPPWWCLLLFLLGGGYIINKDFNSILILVIITVSLVIVGDIILMALVTKYLDFNYILPFMHNAFSMNKWICLILIIGSLSSISISLPYLSEIYRSESLTRFTTFAIAICAILVVFSILSILTFFGPIRAANIFYPEYVESQRVQIASFLEFGELFYIFRTVCMWFLKYILSSYGILLLYKDKIKNKKLFIFLYSLIAFITSYLLTESQYYLFYSLKILQLINLVTFIITPCIIFILYSIKNKSKVTK